jgi:hypothetical protein
LFLSLNILRGPGPIAGKVIRPGGSMACDESPGWRITFFTIWPCVKIMAFTNLFFLKSGTEQLIKILLPGESR